MLSLLESTRNDVTFVSDVTFIHTFDVTSLYETVKCLWNLEEMQLHNNLVLMCICC